jgi:fucose 4-O-acetylase-like acetyltransferase
VYLPWIQWIFPGMPEVFFVSGVVTAAALRKRGATSVVLKRFRRLLPPYYVYAAVGLAVMAVTDSRSTDPAASLDRGDWLSHLLPIVRPTGSTTRVILWGHLWFLTVFLWVLLLSPLMFWLYRRVRAWSLLPHLILFGIVIASEKFGWFALRSEYYDIAMFGWFFQLGFLYDDGTLQSLKARTHIAIGAVLLTAGSIVAFAIEPIANKRLDELYSSPTAHLLVGGGWMFLAFAARQPLTQWLNTHRASAVDLITQRTYTLFIWGPSANAVAMAASRKVGGAGGNLVVYLATTVVTLAGLVLLFGWIEDWASSRRPRLLPAI